VFSLTSALLHSRARKSRIVLVNLLILVMIPLGALTAYFTLKPENLNWMGSALGFSAGTFLHISLSDLLPEAHRHSTSRLSTSLMLIAGLGLMWLLENHLW
jgi:zinc and cadmium transporter